MTAELKSRLTLKLENLRAIVEQKQKSESSGTMEIGGFNWRLEVQKTKVKQIDSSNAVALDLSIHCNESQMDSLWLCHAQFVLHVQQGDQVATWPAGAFDSYEQIFFNGHHVWNALEINILCGQNWNIEEMIILELELISLQQSSIGKNMPALDTNLHITFDEKTEIVVVNKFILAGISNYFRNLFFGQWAERKEQAEGQEEENFTIVEEAEFDIGAFSVMLNSAQLMGWTVHTSKFLNAQLAFKILAMCIKYDVPMLQDYCVKFLIKSDDIPIMEMLGLADELGICELMNHCLNSITSGDFVLKIARNSEIRSHLTEQTRLELDERLVESAKISRECRMERQEDVPCQSQPLIRRPRHFNR